ncbi:MAG: chaperone modulator CbpM [Chitinophagaceae bacterium]
MQKEYINITEFCSSHHINAAFVVALANEGLIDITVIESSSKISEEQLSDLERYTRWQYEMGLDPEAIIVIRRLLDKMELMKQEINYLHSRLSLYE